MPRRCQGEPAVVLRRVDHVFHDPILVQHRTQEWQRLAAPENSLPRAIVQSQVGLVSGLCSAPSSAVRLPYRDHGPHIGARQVGALRFDLQLLVQALEPPLVVVHGGPARRSGRLAVWRC